MERLPQTDEEWQTGRDEARSLTETIFGPKVGIFTLEQPATTGDHPDEVRKAWIGIPLPVYETLAIHIGEQAEIPCVDAFNALVEADAPVDVLQYWIDLLDGNADVDATFTFPASDGVFDRV